MTIQAATPYLILNGRAAEAIELYCSALRATTEVVQRFGDVDKSCPEALRDNVMHAALRVGKALIMLSDGGPVGEPAKGTAVNVALDLDDAAEAKRIFDALATSGKVVQPLMDAPWGALFGALEDKFGIAWMFNCAKKPG